MNALKWALAGGAGGVVGAIVWIGVGYATGYEVGWIAWGVGFLVGMGVRLVGESSNETGGVPAGVTAGVIAIATVFIAKYIVVALLVGKFAAEHLPDTILEPDTEVMISEQADKIVEEREAAGKTIKWPPEKDDDDDASLQAQYPKDIWAAAAKRWKEMPADEREKELQRAREEMAEVRELIKSIARSEGFKGSFNFWDVLWFGLAAFTAFKLGSGAETGERRAGLVR